MTPFELPSNITLERSRQLVAAAEVASAEAEASYAEAAYDYKEVEAELRHATGQILTPRP